MDYKKTLQQLHLLFVDDDTDTCAQAYALFSPLFHSVTLTHDTTSAMSHLINHDIDLIMTDIEMPNESGLSFIEKVRCSHPSLPIVILSAYAEKDYLFKAANLSIDGYLMKPIRQRTLTPILQKISLRFPLLSLDHQLGEAVFYESNSHILTVDNCPTSLGKKETLLLELLLKNKTTPSPKKLIEETIWPDNDVSSSTLKSLINSLRKKLGYGLIENIPSQGWRLKSNVKLASD